MNLRHHLLFSLLLCSLLTPFSVHAFTEAEIEALLEQADLTEIDGRRYAKVPMQLILQLAQERGTNIQSALKGVDAARSGLQAASAKYESTLTASVQQGKSVSWSSGASSGLDASGAQVNSTTLGTSFRKPTSSGISYSLNYSDTTSTSTGITRAEAGGSVTVGSASDAVNTSRLTASVDVPIFQDWGDEVNDASIHLAEIGVDRTMLGARLTEDQTLKQVASIYWDLAGIVESIEVQKQAVKLSERLLQDNKARLGAGIVKPIDVSQSELQLLRDQQTLRGSRNSQLGVEDQVRAVLNLPELPVGLLPEDRPKVRRLTLSSEDLLKRVYQADVQLQQLDADVRTNRVELTQALNKDQTNLDLNLTYVLNGYSSSGSATSDFSESALHGYSATLTWTVPLGGTSAEEGVLQKRIASEQNQLSIEQRRSELQVTLNSLLRALELSEVEIRTNQSLLKITQDQLRNEIERFRLGQSTSFQVAQFQQEVAKAQQNEILSRIRYEKNYLDLLVLSGSLHTEYQLNR